MNGRIYDPTLGRFLQADPFIQAPKNSQNYNRYSYVLNNPMSYTDPSGYYALGNIFKPFKKAVRGFFRAIGVKASSWLVNIGSAFCGPYYAACVAAGNYEVARAFGTSKTGALRGAFSSGVMAYVGGPPDGLNVVVVAAELVDPNVGKVVNFLYNGFDINELGESALSLMHEVKNYYVSQEMARFARRNGMTLQELNALLTLNSFVGNEITGSRYDEFNNEMSGFTSRSNGWFPESINGFIGVIWDINDTILGYQGLLDASGYDYITSENVGMDISGCHSLGTLTCNNLVARGYAPSAQLNSIPFGNIAVGVNATSANLGKWDLVNGGWLGRIFNPMSNSTDCSNAGTSGAFCHGWDYNYRARKPL